MQDKNKPIIFSMARLDKVKNLTGLVSWFANNKRLQKLVNLVLVGGIVDPSQSNDREEKQQCEEVSIRYVPCLLIVAISFQAFSASNGVSKHLKKVEMV